MSRNKKPVLFVAIALGALTLLPLLIWLIASLVGSGRPIQPVPAVAGSADAVQVVDYDLRQVAERAEQLLSEDLAKALREGDVSLDFVAGLRNQADKANADLRSGKLRRAEVRLLSLVSVAENQLAAIAAADQARALKDRTYAALQRLDYLRPVFEKTYREAVETYNKALLSLEAGDFLQSAADFELAAAILGDLEARSMQQIANLLESARDSLENYRLGPARQAFEAVLNLDAANTDATEGLTMVGALEGIADEVKAIRALEDAGQLEEALAGLERLAAEQPDNAFIKNQRASLEARIIKRDFSMLVESSQHAEAAGDYAAAIADLEAALKLKSDVAQQARLAELQEKYKAARLEMLLDHGFRALKDGRYEAARNLYTEAVALGPDSKEARTGLEKAASLYLASIRYSQNISGAERYIGEGRYPLAAKLFNEAMSSRPATITPVHLRKEKAIRSTLEAQSREVGVTVSSDGRTYVSIIGVMPPDRFKETELKLFPDVYKVRGSRKGYQDVELELKVDAMQGDRTIHVQCSKRIQ